MKRYHIAIGLSIKRVLDLQSGTDFSFAFGGCVLLWCLKLKKGNITLHQTAHVNIFCINLGLITEILRRSIVSSTYLLSLSSQEGLQVESIILCPFPQMQMTLRIWHPEQGSHLPEIGLRQCYN